MSMRQKEMFKWCFKCCGVGEYTGRPDLTPSGLRDGPLMALWKQNLGYK